MFSYVLCRSYSFHFLVSEYFNACLTSSSLSVQCIAVSLPVLYSTVCRCVAACGVQYSVSSHYIPSPVAVTVSDF